MELGYALSSEEHSPQDLVQHARRAEETGFEFALISDHYHPWVSAQGNSPFVWAVLGGIAQVTTRLRIGTGVTCPTIRIHPAIVAHAAATVAAMLPGRFFLGVGSGEALNEHILGDPWPALSIRLEYLEEAVAAMRQLWEGGNQSFYGQYYTIENAHLFTLPEEPVPVYVATSGPESAELAGAIGDAMITTSADAKTVKAFEEAGGQGKDKYGQMTVCWAKTEAEARQTTFKLWPTGAMQGALTTNLPLTEHFDEAAKMVREEDVAKHVVCGPDPERHLAKIREYVEAGLTHVYVHQIGPDQEGFFQFYEREIRPRLGEVSQPARSGQKQNGKKERSR
jgi:coenzyme F420-dependent glucose-6-phosphate dehydrogenase